MKPIRIGVIGSGAMATVRAGHFLSAEAGARVAWVAGRNSITGKELARECQAQWIPDWRQAMVSDEVEAVFIATPNDLHGAMTLSALAAGKAVLCEYPACRHITELIELQSWLRSSTGPVLAYTHREDHSRCHDGLRGTCQSLGAPLGSLFQRVTPGRGARPEILFHLGHSGPPALFFIYHLYPVLDLFGDWREAISSAIYTGLTPEGRYDRFFNNLSVRFQNGAIGEWRWAGGVPVPSASESHTLLFNEGSLTRSGNKWKVHPAELDPCWEEEVPELEKLISLSFLDLVRNPDKTEWKRMAQRALDATALGLAAEVAQRERRPVARSEVFVDG